MFEKLAFGSRAEAVLGVAATPQTSLASLAITVAMARVVVLEGVEKPGNVGAGSDNRRCRRLRPPSSWPIPERIC